MVNIAELKPYGVYDFIFRFDFPYELDIIKARGSLRNYQPTRYASFVPKTIGGREFNLRVASSPYFTNPTAIVSENSILFRSWFPQYEIGKETEEREYLFKLIENFLEPFALEEIIKRSDYEKILEYFKEKIIKLKYFRIMKAKLYYSEGKISLRGKTDSGKRRGGKTPQPFAMLDVFVYTNADNIEETEKKYPDSFMDEQLVRLERIIAFSKKQYRNTWLKHVTIEHGATERGEVDKDEFTEELNKIYRHIIFYDSKGEIKKGGEYGEDIIREWEKAWLSWLNARGYEKAGS